MINLPSALTCVENQTRKAQCVALQNRKQRFEF